MTLQVVANEIVMQRSLIFLLSPLLIRLWETMSFRRFWLMFTRVWWRVIIRSSEIKDENWQRGNSRVWFDLESQRLVLFHLIFHVIYGQVVKRDLNHAESILHTTWELGFSINQDSHPCFPAGHWASSSMTQWFLSFLSNECGLRWWKNSWKIKIKWKFAVSRRDNS